MTPKTQVVGLGKTSLDKNKNWTSKCWMSGWFSSFVVICACQ